MGVLIPLVRELGQKVGHINLKCESIKREYKLEAVLISGCVQNI